VVSQWAGHWSLVPEHSKVAFSQKTIWGLVQVHGSLGVPSGEAEVGDDGSVQGSLTIDATTIDTKNSRRDKHLRSADFFHVDVHPAITYRVSQAEIGPDAVVLTGELEVIGHVRPLTVRARVQQEPDATVVLSSEVTIDRDEFGMSWNRMGAMKGLTTLSIVAAFSR
jgi:polyisoprenoid-binding protein YceI